ncbi:MAG: hypothetical protein Q7P63_14335 [Verrucomicrobiota bacterium JB022]|nr:hypothetical protein [Verrucomicrobiota bacterium JB022]
MKRAGIRRLSLLLFSLVLLHLLNSQDLRMRPRPEEVFSISEEEAGQAALEVYKTRLADNFDPEVKVARVNYFRLGYDVQDFGDRRDPVWSVILARPPFDYMGLVWVHAQTKQVYFINGPWPEAELPPLQ